jgi:hypothetical protein
MTRFMLTRRTLLRGAAHGIGAAVALPVLDAMLNGNGTALAQGMPLPVRLGSWFWGNGVIASAWFPTGTGPGWNLSPLLQPLVNVKPYVSVLDGMVVYLPLPVGGHMSSLMSVCSGAPGTSQGGLNYAYTKPSFDQVIADKIGTTTRFKSLHFGVASTDTSDADFGVMGKAISHNGPNSPNLPIYDPIAIYDRVFGTGFSVDGGTPSDVTLANRKSVLDVVAADTKALQGRLGARDRQRLDQHLQGITELEKQLMGMPVMTTGACMKPLRPTSSYPAIDSEQIQWDALDAAQTQLLAVALACDQTRVFTYRFSPCNDFTVYPGFPTFTIDPTTTNTGSSMHGMTHQEGGDQPGVQKCVTFAMGKLAGLLEKLMAMPEGAGNVLDNCAILAFSECTEGRTHNATSAPGIPMLIAGRAGGKLVYPGIHYRSPAQGDAPGETNGRNVSCVPLTLMQALGTGITTYGAAAGTATKVISELLM